MRSAFSTLSMALVFAVLPLAVACEMDSCARTTTDADVLLADAGFATDALASCVLTGDDDVREAALRWLHENHRGPEGAVAVCLGIGDAMHDYDVQDWAEASGALVAVLADLGLSVHGLADCDYTDESGYLRHEGEPAVSWRLGGVCQSGDLAAIEVGSSWAPLGGEGFRLELRRDESGDWEVLSDTPTWIS